MIPHGTISRYTYYRCRCDECRLASRDQKRKERAAMTDEQRERATARERALKDVRKAWRE